MSGHKFTEENGNYSILKSILKIDNYMILIHLNLNSEELSESSISLNYIL